MKTVTGCVWYSVPLRLVTLKVFNRKVTRVVMATAYNATPDQTDDTPDVCAWEDKIRLGIIAISRDPEKSGLTRGKEVLIEGIGKVVVMDRMHYRKRNQIDL